MTDAKAAPVSAFPALRFADGRQQWASDSVIAERAIALSYNGRVYAVMLATPADLEDFAYGFSLSAGIIEHFDQLRVIEILTQERGLVLEMLIPQARFDACIGTTRRLPGTAGCGLCGSESLSAALSEPPRLGQRLRVDPQTITRAMAELGERQVWNAISGGVHAAGHVGEQGLILREDIGRHNALDKLIGARLRQGAAMDEGFVVMSSRCSYEIVDKAARAGVRAVLSLSAPTAFAIRKAAEADIALYALAGENVAAIC